MSSFESVEVLPYQSRADGGILKIADFLGNYMGKISGNIVISGLNAIYVCRTKRGSKTRAFWGISWYHRTYNVIAEVSQIPMSL